VQVIFLHAEGNLKPEHPMPYKPTGRKGGAQPGNTNALKHGIYSQQISVQDDEQTTAMPIDNNNDELTFARIRLKDCILKQQAAPPEDWLSYEKAITVYLGKIVSMVHHNAVLGSDKKTAFMTVMEMIRQVNEEQHVN
jgi:hypothetical protein